MFKKLLALIKSPKKHGNSTPELGGQRWVKTYDLILSNMDGAPAYPLSHQLTIGSEIGNIVIDDPSVSPRHATVLLQEEVISILDHGSVAGTFVNGTKIPAGKFIILEDSDSISVGDLEIKIGVKAKAVDNTAFLPPGHDHLEGDEGGPEEERKEDEEETEADDEADQNSEDEEDVEDVELDVDEEADEPTVTKSRAYMGLFNKPKPQASKASAKKKKKISFSLPSYDAANSIIRVLAISSDLLLSFIVLTVFLPFDDFRNFLNFIPTEIADLGDFKWENLWVVATEELGTSVTDLLREVYLIANEIVPVLQLVLVFFLIRFTTTLIFGVSISEFMFGMRGNFNFIWARVGGLLRVIIGMITWPLVIFDLPALASKRTFKEFITFTNTYVGSRVTLFFGLILYFPLLLILLLVSPMFIGLELVEPIAFNPTVSRRVKQKPAETSVAGEVVQKKMVGSQFLGISLNYDPQKLSLIPSFKFKGEKSKLNMKVSLEIFKRDGEQSTTIELFKTFDFKELLKLGLKGNFMLHEEYQKIYNYAYSAENTNRFFKLPENPKDEENFGKQVVDFTAMAFGLGVESLPDFMISKTPLIKSVVDYRTTLLGLFEYKDFQEIAPVMVGKILCLRFTYDGQKPFDLLMPILRGEGRIFKISYESKEKIAQVRNDFYKYTLEDLSWGAPKETSSLETYNALEVVDLFTVDIEKGLITSEKAQALYGYYFEKSAEVLRNENMAEYELWKGAVQSVMNVIPYLREATPEDANEGEDVRSKLKSNFSDLFNALENKNRAFFGVEGSANV